jgi:hypothetical protein
MSTGLSGLPRSFIVSKIADACSSLSLAISMSPTFAINQ